MYYLAGAVLLSCIVCAINLWQINRVSLYKSRGLMRRFALIWLCFTVFLLSGFYFLAHLTMTTKNPTSELANASPPSSSALQLQSLRQQIDEIDGKLFALMQERAELAPQVIKAKGGSPIWRPAREAQIFRRLRDQVRHINHHDNDPKSSSAKPHFPTLSLLEMWARMMTGMTSIEVDFNFALVAPNQILAQDYLRTIRTHFGSLPQVTIYDRAATALTNADRHTIIMMPWPETETYSDAATKLPPDSADHDWWRLLQEVQNKNYVIGMKLPFLPHRETMRPLALLSKIALEPSGDDCTLVIENDPAHPSVKKLVTYNGYKDAAAPEIVKNGGQIIGVYPRPMPPL